MASPISGSFLDRLTSFFQEFYENEEENSISIETHPETYRQGGASLESSLSSYRKSTLSSRSLLLPDACSINHQEKLEKCVNAVIAKLRSQNGEMLKEDFIFRIPGSKKNIAALKKDLPEVIDTNDPHLLASFLKAVFPVDEYVSEEQIRFLPEFFSQEVFERLTQEIKENPDSVKQELSFLFSKQSESVKNFILLLKQAAEFHQQNHMGIESLALLLNPFLTSHIPMENRLSCSSVLAEFMIEYAEEIFPETLVVFNKITRPVLKRVEDTIHAVIDTLNANKGELLKAEHIFAIPVHKSKIQQLQNELPDKFEPEEADPYLLSCLLKTLFHQKAKEDEFRRIRFLPNNFTFVHFKIVTNFLKKDPAYVKSLLHKLFLTQNECVRKFILLLNRTSRLKHFNNMGASKLARVINPLFYSHFSEDEIVQCSTNLAEFIIENAKEIFSEPNSTLQPLQQTDNGEIVFIEPMDEESLGSWLDYNKWFMTHIKQGEVLSCIHPTEYIAPEEALYRISRLFSLIPHIRCYANHKESLFEVIDHLQIEMIELEDLDEEEDDFPMQEQIAAMKKTLEVFQAKVESKKNLGPHLNQELDKIINRDHCDIVFALKNLENKYQEIESSLKQIATDLWRSVMTIVEPGGQEKLISQSSMCTDRWAQIFKIKDYKSLRYGASEVAKEAGFPEDTEITFLAKQVIHSLDYYLFNLGYSSDLKVNIYKQFHQNSMAIFDPTTVTKELLQQACLASKDTSSQSDEEKRLELEARYEAYSQAYLRSGWAISPITPGSKLDTNGFAAFVSSKPEEEIYFKKVFVLTLDLKMQSIFSHYLLQFRNPYTQENETIYYWAKHNYELLPPSFERRELEMFPNLLKLLSLPKFTVHRPGDFAVKSKEEEKESV